MPYICERADSCPAAIGENPCTFAQPHEHQTKSEICKELSKHLGRPTSVADVPIEKGGN